VACELKDAATPNPSNSNPGLQPAGGAGNAAVAGNQSPLAAQELAVLQAVGPQTHDFGRVFEGVALEHTFELNVHGRNPLKLISVHKSCGCTRAEAFVRLPNGTRQPLEMNTAVPPGAQIEVAATLDTYGRGGKQNKPITLYGNVPGGRLELVLLAEVQSLVESTPPILDLGRFVIGSQPEGVVELRSVDGRPFGLQPVPENATEEVQVAVEPLFPDASGKATAYRVTARPGPGLGIGVRNAPLSFVTDLSATDGLHAQSNAQTLRVRLPIAAQVLPLVEARPPSLSFGALSAGMAAERSLELWCYAPGLELDRVAPSLELSLGGIDLGGLFEHELVPLESLPSQNPPVLAGYRLRLRTSGLPVGPNGTFAGRLRFALRRPEQAELVVGVTGIARGQ
jgi:Protein of unknown function (DUF1573)